MPGKNNIFLIGFMGAGKTTLGSALALRLDLPFIDTDAHLEKHLGMSLQSFFRKYGEALFREHETKLLEQLSQQSSCIVALGGGAFTNLLHQKILKDVGCTIYLEASISTLLKRLYDDPQKEKRPLLSNNQKLTQLFIAREAFYKKATIIVKTDGKTISILLEEIEHLVKREGMYAHDR